MNFDSHNEGYVVKYEYLREKVKEDRRIYFQITNDK